MVDLEETNGFAIALAWPETKCKQAGAWYDPLLYHLGINKNGYYKIGHSAVVLINPDTMRCHYFDFGRYHAPHGYGRVRSFETDHDLLIETKAILSEDEKEVLNLEEILTELYFNRSTHGDGRIVGISTAVNFTEAIQYAYDLQDNDFLKYGPFQIGGTNCSRFVSDLIKTSTPSTFLKVKLQFPLTISPSPMWNLWSIGRRHSIIGRSIPEQTESMQLIINQLSL